jgi:hypothetical protein
MSYSAELDIINVTDTTNFKALAGGKVWFGVPDGSPATVPGDRIQIYLARQGLADLAIAQPLDIGPGGQVIYSGTPAQIKVLVPYCVQIMNSLGVQKYYAPKSNGYIEKIQSIESTLATQTTEINKRVKTVATYADIFTALATASIGDQLSLSGHTIGGVGGGVFDVVSSVSLTADTGTTVINGSKAAVRQSNVVYPEDFGVTNGTGTAAFQNFVNCQRAKTITTAITITSAINLPSNCTIKFKSGGKVIWDSSSFPFAFVATSRQNIKLLHPVFESTVSVILSANAGFKAIACKDVRIISPKAINTNAFHAAPNAGSYAAVVADPTSASFNCCKDIIVTNPKVYGPGQDQRAGAGILMEHVIDWSVVGGLVENTGHGLQFWGGDANTNGALVNERKCKNGNVSGFSAKNCAGAVAWGSMGDNIHFSGIVGDTVHDVGIDFEGCIDCSATGGSIKDADNGCLSIFFLNRNVSFNGITCTQTVGGRALFRVYNSTLSQDNIGVSVSGCTFSSRAGLGYCDTASGPCESIKFTDNDLYNVVVDFTYSNNRYIDVSNNSFIFDIQLLASQAALKVGGASNSGKISVKDNNILSKVAQSSSQIGISATHSDFNTNCQFDIYGNKVSGFVVDIQTENTSTNAGISPIFRLKQNTFSSNSFSRVESGAGTSRVMLVDNYKPDGNFPVSLSTGTWDIGQKAFYDTPTAGGFIGEVRTSTGIKTFGAVSP